MARPPKPLELKLFTGTLKDHAGRINKDMPKKSTEEAFPLPTLTENGLMYFMLIKAQLSALNMNSATYSLVINQAADRLDEIDQCSQRLLEEGLTISTFNEKTGVETVKSHPCVAERHNANQHLTRLLSELGLTPSSIQKVSTKPRAIQEGKEQNKSTTPQAETEWNTFLQQ